MYAKFSRFVEWFFSPLMNAQSDLNEETRIRILFATLDSLYVGV